MAGLPGSPRLGSPNVPLGETHPLLSKHPGGHYHMDMNPTIYSAIVYAPAVSRIRSGKDFSRASFMVCSMIALNMILQIGLLRVMDVYGHRDSQGTRFIRIQSREYVNTYETFLSPVEKEAVYHARQGLGHKSPLCTRDEKDMYSCMPSSISFTKEWHLLDSNNDGVWSLSEAMQSDPSPEHDMEHGHDKTLAVFFHSIREGLQKRAEWLSQQNASLYLSQDIVSGHGIPKAYFDYWVGDAMFCSRFDADACENIVLSGLFDSALKKGRVAASHKGIVDINTAARYCRMMLDSNGGCAQMLPATWKSDQRDREHSCGVMSLSPQGVITDPNDESNIMVVMKPSYLTLVQQERAMHVTYQFFTVLIMYLFFASVVDEIRDLMKSTDFLLTFPGTTGKSDPGGIDHGPDTGENQRYEIQRISKRHRVVLGVVTLTRIVILCMLISYGSWFLLSEKNYLELILNAVALTFITGIDEMIYAVFMESTEKKDIGFEESRRIQFKGFMPREDGSWAGYAFRKDAWGLFILPIVSVCVVLVSNSWDRQPIINALRCACMQEGDHCMESMYHEEPWWHRYWTQTLPAAIHHIQALRVQGG